MAYVLLSHWFWIRIPARSYTPRYGGLYYTQLLVHSKLVKILPYLHKLPVLKMEKHHCGDTDMLSSGWYILPPTII